MSSNIRAYPPGIHAPTVTFFLEGEQQEIDWATQEKHLAYLVKAGVHGSMFYSLDTFLLDSKS